VRKPFDYSTDLTGRSSGPDNPTVTSKAVRRYGRNETTGEQPAELYREPVNGDAPLTHHNRPFKAHVETVGWHPHTHKFVRATHPNAEAKAPGGANFPSPPLEPVGMTHSKYGGQHGEPQKRPGPSGNHGGKKAPLGSLNDRDIRGRKS
jgi:hypothetical protein